MLWDESCASTSCLQAHIKWSAWILAGLSAARFWKDSSTRLELQPLGRTSTTLIGKGLEFVSSCFPKLRLCLAEFMLQLRKRELGDKLLRARGLEEFEKWQLLAISQLRHLPLTYQGPLCDLCRTLHKKVERCLWGEASTSDSLQQTAALKPNQTLTHPWQTLHTKQETLGRSHRQRPSHIAEISHADCVYNRDAVVEVDQYAGKESDEFQPQKRANIYGITTAYAQCLPGSKPV